MNGIARALASLGRAVIAALAGVGRVTLYAADTVSHLARPPFYWREFGQALMQIGWLSLPVVGMTALFTGGALALQIYAGGARFNAETVVPSIVAIGLTRELGPVLGGLMVAARVASSIAAEIGTMKVTEQIDALVTLSTQPDEIPHPAARAGRHARRAGAGGRGRRHRHHGRVPGRCRAARFRGEPICRTRSIFSRPGT